MVRARRARGASGPTAVVWRPLATLTPNPRNARVHSAAQIAGIAESIAAFGFNAPILVDREGMVLAGHGRLLAAQSLGLKEAPTIALDHLNPAERRAFMIADNRLQDRSCWDEKLLALELKALKTLDLDFSLTATGFDLDEIDLRVGTKAPSAAAPTRPPPGRPGAAGSGRAKGQAEEEEAGKDAGKRSPGGGGRRAGRRRGADPAARPGDVWALGPHLLLCADDDDAEDPAALAAIDAAISRLAGGDGRRAPGSTRPRSRSTRSRASGALSPA